MVKRVRPIEPTLQPIRDVGAHPPRIEPGTVASALGAEEVGGRLEEALAPITLQAVREELFERLRSSGGRPALAGVRRRAKVPLGDQEWLELEELAEAIATPGFAPSAGQVASVLLKLSVRELAPQVRREAGGSSPRLARELAARTAAESAPP